MVLQVVTRVSISARKMCAILTFCGRYGRLIDDDRDVIGYSGS